MNADNSFLPTPLRRLISPELAEDLLAKFQALAPEVDLALADVQGRRFAGRGEWEADPLSRLLATQVDGRPVDFGQALVQPLLANGKLAGALLATGGAQAAPALAALAAALRQILEQALETRELGAEILERYREINLLYQAAATFGACLDPAQIAWLVLEQIQSVVPVDAALLLLVEAAELPDNLSPAASFGPESTLQALWQVSRQIAGRVLQTGSPMIFAPAANPAVSAADQIGTALCAPLLAQERSLGVLLLGRKAAQPEITAGQEKLVMALAGQAAIALETARLHQSRLDFQRLEEELAIGRQIQESFLPGECPEFPGWEFAAAYRAARQVGGDLYDFFSAPSDPGRLNLVIADVTGKGVAAALYMAFTRTLLRSTAAQVEGPASILRSANRLIMQERRAGLFLTAFFISLDVRTGRMVYANGGHEWPLLRRAATGTLQALDAPGRLLGAFQDILLEERQATLEPGDFLVLYTDGVTDARSTAGELYDEERLERVVLEAGGDASDDSPLSASGLLQALMDDIENFSRGAEPSDDLTLVVIRRQARG